MNSPNRLEPKLESETSFHEILRPQSQNFYEAALLVGDDFTEDKRGWASLLRKINIVSFK